ncbi:MAG: hypothetical protein K2N95_14665 [Lachnospiraceae bacterium]|nr:hypothetical protein [Lachnospiraceae bacterium]
MRRLFFGFQSYVTGDIDAVHSSVRDADVDKFLKFEELCAYLKLFHAK